ncbi:MAG: hypothetical protein AOA65_1618 [Candidatus Bathyarchaeota archaeon BA1]|nr:MAG: hypothetical protein AOA65_1618 [Candidatus Bathyarchaeota archaeon BA1]
MESDGTYDIWIRVGFTDFRGKLSIFIDDILRGEIRPYAHYWAGLKWVNITRLEDLKSGNHIITLTNDGTGLNDVDAIAIVKPSQFQSKMEEALNALQRFPGRLIYVLGAENAFTYDPLPSGWSIAFSPYNGFTLHTERGVFNVSPKAHKASASSIWKTIGFEAHKANDGFLNTRWASLHGMPQWLQMEWATRRS